MFLSRTSWNQIYQEKKTKGELKLYLYQRKYLNFLTGETKR